MAVTQRDLDAFLDEGEPRDGNKIRREQKQDFRERQKKIDKKARKQDRREDRRDDRQDDRGGGRGSLNLPNMPGLGDAERLLRQLMGGGGNGGGNPFKGGGFGLDGRISAQAGHEIAKDIRELGVDEAVERYGASAVRAVTDRRLANPKGDQAFWTKVDKKLGDDPEGPPMDAGPAPVIENGPGDAGQTGMGQGAVSAEVAAATAGPSAGAASRSASAPAPTQVARGPAASAPAPAGTRAPSMTVAQPKTDLTLQRSPHDVFGAVPTMAHPGMPALPVSTAAAPQPAPVAPDFQAVAAGLPPERAAPAPLASGMDPRVSPEGMAARERDAIAKAGGLPPEQPSSWASAIPSVGEVWGGVKSAADKVMGNVLGHALNATGVTDKIADAAGGALGKVGIGGRSPTVLEGMLTQSPALNPGRTAGIPPVDPMQTGAAYQSSRTASVSPTASTPVALSNPSADKPTGLQTAAPTGLFAGPTPVGAPVTAAEIVPGSVMNPPQVSDLRTVPDLDSYTGRGTAPVAPSYDPVPALGEKTPFTVTQLPLGEIVPDEIPAQEVERPVLGVPMDDQAAFQSLPEAPPAQPGVLSDIASRAMANLSEVAKTSVNRDLFNQPAMPTVVDGRTLGTGHYSPTNATGRTGAALPSATGLTAAEKATIEARTAAPTWNDAIVPVADVFAAPSTATPAPSTAAAPPATASPVSSTPSLSGAVNAPGSGGYASRLDTAPVPAVNTGNPVRDAIYSAEARVNGYNSVTGLRDAVPITEMTLAQAQAYQADRQAKGLNTAIGAMQAKDTTLAQVAREMGLPLDTKLTPEVQDRITDHLMDKAGYQAFVDGKISANTFQNNLAGTWAGVPNARGVSSYAGKAGNKANITNSEIRSAMAAARTPAPAAVATKPAPVAATLTPAALPAPSAKPASVAPIAPAPTAAPARENPNWAGLPAAQHDKVTQQATALSNAIKANEATLPTAAPATSPADLPAQDASEMFGTAGHLSRSDLDAIFGDKAADADWAKVEADRALSSPRVGPTPGYEAWEDEDALNLAVKDYESALPAINDKAPEVMGPPIPGGTPTPAPGSQSSLTTPGKAPGSFGLSSDWAAAATPTGWPSATPAPAPSVTAALDGTVMGSVAAGTVHGSALADRSSATPSPTGVAPAPAEGLAPSGPAPGADPASAGSTASAPGSSGTADAAGAPAGGDPGGTGADPAGAAGPAGPSSDPAGGGLF